MSKSDEYPRFRIVLRGYDPTDVEEILEELYSSLNEAVEQIEELNDRQARHTAAMVELQNQLQASTDRTRVLELELVSTVLPTSQSLGTRITSILASAEEEAVEIRKRALEEAEQVCEGAKAAAEALQLQMDESADSIVLAARAEAKEVRQQGERWITASQNHRMAIRSHIDQIRQLLVAVTSGVDQETPHEQTHTTEIARKDRPREEPSP